MNDSLVLLIARNSFELGMGVVSPKLEAFTFKKFLIKRSQPPLQQYAIELTTLGQPGVEEMPSADLISRCERFWCLSVA